MLITYWILAGLLGFAYLAAGFMKATQPKEKLAEGGMAWTENASPTVVKLIGILEIAGALGLILPPLTGIAPVLAPIAAIGLVLVQIGAIIVHIRRGETKVLPMNIVLLLVAAVAAWFGFALWV